MDSLQLLEGRMPIVWAMHKYRDCRKSQKRYITFGSNSNGVLLSFGRPVRLSILLRPDFLWSAPWVAWTSETASSSYKSTVWESLALSSSGRMSSSKEPGWDSEVKLSAKSRASDSSAALSAAFSSLSRSSHQVSSSSACWTWPHCSLSWTHTGAFLGAFLTRVHNHIPKNYIWDVMRLATGKSYNSGSRLVVATFVGLSWNRSWWM